MLWACGTAAAGPDTFVSGTRTGSSQARNCLTNNPPQVSASTTNARSFFRLLFMTCASYCTVGRSFSTRRYVAIFTLKVSCGSCDVEGRTRSRSSMYTNSSAVSMS